MKSVCVFCGGNPGARPSYARAADALGGSLAESGVTLVYGGAKVGLMGRVADAALARGGRVVGILPRFLADREVAHEGLSELVLVSSMHERKAMMAARSDGFAALPGGFGTLEETFEVLTWAQLGLHAKPFALVNVEGYYDGLVAFMDHAAAEGLVQPQHRAMVRSVSDPREVLAVLRAPAGPPRVAPAIEPSQT